MGKSLMRYDIAISFAEEDAKAADQLYHALKKRCVKTYNYRFANNIMDNLRDLTLRIFRNRSNFIVVFISRNYALGKWTNREWQVIRKAQSDRKYKGVILIRIDNSSLPGLKDEELYLEWKDNPKKIAKLILQRMKEKGFTTLCRAKLVLLIGLFICAGFILFVLTK